MGLQINARNNPIISGKQSENFIICQLFSKINWGPKGSFSFFIPIRFFLSL